MWYGGRAYRFSGLGKRSTRSWCRLTKRVAVLLTVNTLPAGLKHLNLGDAFNQPLSGSELPDGLEVLVLCTPFHYLSMRRWPPALNQLKFKGEGRRETRRTTGVTVGGSHLGPWFFQPLTATRHRDSLYLQYSVYVLFDWRYPPPWDRWLLSAQMEYS